MAGRKAHVQDSAQFAEFMQSIPEYARAHGYWRIKREATGPKGGGVIQSFLGFIEFHPDDTYESLRQRVKEAFAETRGPGIYFAIPCDADKKEIKNVDKARFEFKESEVPMPETPAPPEVNPLSDTLRTVKKVTSDMASLQSMELQQKILNKFLGTDKEKKEDESVKEPTSNTAMTDFLLWQSFLGDSSKKKDSGTDLAIVQQLNDLKMERLISERLEKAMAELKSLVQPKHDDKIERLLEKLIEAQAKPKDDDKIERLIEKMQESQNRIFEKMLEIAKSKEDSKFERLLEQMASSKQENTFQSMLAMMVKQSEDREKIRAEEERRREEERREERRRAEEERKEERRRLEEQTKLEREKFEKELREQQRRFDEEAKLRREEMRREEEKSREYAAEQQRYNLELLNIFKNNRDSSLDTAAKIVEAMTTAGMTSMKTSQDAAETIMEIAKTAGLGRKDKEADGKGFIEHIRDIAQIAAPLIAPYADADAKMKVLRAASKMSRAALNPVDFGGQRKPPALPTDVSDGEIAGFSKAEIDAAAAVAAQHGFSRADVENALRAAAQSGMSRADIEAAIQQMGSQSAAGLSGASQAAPPKTPPQASQEAASVNKTTGDGSKGSNIGGTRAMIAQYLKVYPILKHALIGNLRDKIGVKGFLPVVTGLNQPTLEGLLANVPHQIVMNEVKQVCSDDEAKLVDENEEWFIKFRQEMIEVLREEEEEEEEPSTTAANK
jgi:hypothetical protein